MNVCNCCSTGDLFAMKSRHEYSLVFLVGKLFHSQEICRLTLLALKWPTNVARRMGIKVRPHTEYRINSRLELLLRRLQTITCPVGARRKVDFVTSK